MVAGSTSYHNSTLPHLYLPARAQVQVRKCRQMKVMKGIRFILFIRGSSGSFRTLSL